MRKMSLVSLMVCIFSCVDCQSLVEIPRPLALGTMLEPVPRIHAVLAGVPTPIKNPEHSLVKLSTHLDIGYVPMKSPDGKIFYVVVDINDTDNFVKDGSDVCLLPVDSKLFRKLMRVAQIQIPP